MLYRVLLPTVLAGVITASWGCQLHNRPADAGVEFPAQLAVPPSPFTVSPMHVQTIGGMTWLFARTRASFDDLPEAASRIIADLHRLAANGQLHSAGPILFIYDDPSEDASQPCPMRIGMPIADHPARPPAGFEVESLPAFQCAAVTYCGPLRLLPRAYGQLIPRMIEAGFVPSEQTRRELSVVGRPRFAPERGPH